jgi:serine/threonine protein kinase
MFEGRFQIMSVLGQGGVGVVYKAKQTHMNKIVAIKTLMLSVVSDDAASFNRFEQEAQAASSLNHPNIISIFDFGKSANGLAYLVMEYLGSKNLDDVLETDKRLGPDRFLRVAGQICDGLQHAHKKGVIHRDIKPTNIMLVTTEDAVDVVKIVDFGLAKLTAVESEKHLTKTGTIIGTPLYMSPEQCRGLDLDHRSDIYSLGCVLYMALTGKEPIQGTTALDTLYKHTAQPPIPFKVACPEIDLPPRLEQVILKSLQKDPTLRQQSMTELRNDITDAIYYRSFHSGITAINVDPAVALAASKDSPPGTGLSQTLDLSHPRPQPAPPAVPKPAREPVVQSVSQPASQTENDQEQHRTSAGRESPALRSLQGSAAPTKDHVVISKSLLAAGLGAVVVIGAFAYFLGEKTNVSNTVPPTAATAPKPQQTASLAPTAATAPKPEQKPSHPPAVETSLASKQKPSVAPEAKRTQVPATVPSPAIESTAKSSSRATHLASLAAVAPRATALVERVSSHMPTLERLRLNSHAHDSELTAQNAFQNKDFQTAESNYIICLQLHRQVYGDNNYHTFPILAHLIACQLQPEKKEQLKIHLIEATEIFKNHTDDVLNLVSPRADAFGIWTPLARGSHQLARETHTRVYLTWSVTFYKLAMDAWKGPIDTAGFRRFADGFCSVLEESGDLTTANKMRFKLNLPDQHNAAATPAKPKPTTTAKPKSTKKAPSIIKRGSFVERSY